MHCYSINLRSQNAIMHSVICNLPLQMYLLGMEELRFRLPLPRLQCTLGLQLSYLKPSHLHKGDV